jgi:hypothetical protein
VTKVVVTCEQCASGAVDCLDDEFDVWQCSDCGAVFTANDDPVLVDEVRPVRRPRRGLEEAHAPRPPRWTRPRPKYEDSDGPG